MEPIQTPDGLVLPAGQVNDETRAELRRAALESTYFMAKSVLGFKDLTPKLHWEMCKWIENGRTHKHGVVPRDHLKTSIWTITDTARRAVRDPNIRILLGNETATNASHFLRRIEAIWDRNQLFRWLFPEVIWWDEAKRGKWSEVEMVIPRSNDYNESTIESIGVGGAVVSRHYNLIKLDDLVGKDASESAEVMKKTLDWYQYAESLLDHPVLSEIQNFGTPWALFDLHQWILKNEQDIDVFFRGCYDKDGNPIWSERFSPAALDRIKRKIGFFKFSCQYLCKPHDPDSGGFDERDLRYWSWVNGFVSPRSGDDRARIDPGTFRYYIRVDPAISEKRGAARTAIVVDGLAPDGKRLFLMESWAKRCTPFEMIDRLFELDEQYNPESIGIESVAYQRILKPVIEAEAERRNRWLNIVEFKPDTGTRKENRIYGKLHPVFKRAQYWVNPDLHEEWLDEFRQFPNGQVCDLLDATAYGDEQWEMGPLQEEEDYDDWEMDPDDEKLAREAMATADVDTGY